MNSYENIIGHAEEIQRLKQLLISQKIPHGILFWGEEGIGKLKIAKGFAKQVIAENESPAEEKRTFDRIENGNHPDFMIVDLEEGKTEINVAQIEEINKHCLMLSEKVGSKKVYIINQAEKLNEFASNRFLKTLEEPPANVIFILVTSFKNAILPTILSRCQLFFFKPLAFNEVSTIISLYYNDQEVKPKEQVVNSAVYLSYGKPGKVIYFINQDFQDVFAVLNSFLNAGIPAQFDDLLHGLENYINKQSKGVATKTFQQRAMFLAFLEVSALYFREFIAKNPDRENQCKLWNIKNLQDLHIDSRAILNIMDTIEKYNRNIHANGNIGLLTYSFCMTISKTWNSQFLQMK